MAAAAVGNDSRDDSCPWCTRIEGFTGTEHLSCKTEAESQKSPNSEVVINFTSLLESEGKSASGQWLWEFYEHVLNVGL